VEVNLLEIEKCKSSMIMNIDNLEHSFKLPIKEMISKDSGRIHSFKSLSDKLDVELECESINLNKKNIDSSECKLEIINYYGTSNFYDPEAEKEHNTQIYDRLIKLNADQKLEINSEQEFDFEQTSSLITYQIPNIDSKNKIEQALEKQDFVSYKDEKKKIENDSERIVLKQNKVKGNLNEHVRRINILLVDDERFIRNSESNQIKKFFKNRTNYEFDITECSDGVECLYKIYKGIQEGIKYDYVISDESMNFMRGTLMINVLNTLIEENMMYKIKIFMVTSYEPWAIKNTYGDICDGIITKPMSQENLSNIFNF
jgi:CheY-like chemotaxis protein